MAAEPRRMQDMNHMEPRMPCNVGNFLAAASRRGAPRLILILNRAPRASESLGLTEFRRCYEGAQPLKLLHVAVEKERWSLDRLRRLLGTRLCRCHVQDDALALTSGNTKLSVIRLPFEQYASYMETHRDVEPLYLFQELDADMREAPLLKGV